MARLRLAQLMARLRLAEEMSRLCYRVQQFLSEVRRQAPVEAQVLDPYLSTAQIGLFRSMLMSEQRHALDMLHVLQEQGHSDHVLAQAALLHDAGKTCGRVRLWHRVAKVLLQAIHPGLLCRLAKDDPDDWRYPFYVLLHHARLGADRAAGVGTDPLVVALIYWHHTAPEHSGLDSRKRTLLTLLRSADERT